MRLRFGITLLAASLGMPAATLRPALNFQKTFGGTGVDSATSIAVDRDGNTYVTGTTTSRDFPLKNALQPQIGGARLRLSSDRGNTWSTPVVAAPVYAVAGSPKQPNIVYAGTDSGVLKSVDGGKTWASLSSAPPNWVNALVVDTLNPDLIYDATTSGTYRSVDGGATWRSTAPGGDAIVLVSNPARPSTLFQAIAEPGNPQPPDIYRTTDSAATWTLLPNSPPGAFSLACEPTHPDTLYAAASTYGYFSNAGTQAIYKSTDAGDTWSKVSDLPVAVSTFALAANATAVYAGTANGVFLSRDGGITWTPTSITSRADNIATDPYDPLIVYASADRIFRSIDGGATWTPSLAVRQDVQTLTIVPTNPPSVFMGGTPGQNIFVTKWSADGKQMLYSTYLGGSFYDFATGIAVDAQGNAFVTGYAYSLDFPVTSGAPQKTNLGSANAFLAKIAPDGGKLLFSTYLGGSTGDAASAIAVDNSGIAVLTGYAGSADFPLAGNVSQRFLLQKCPQASPNAPSPFNLGDAFVTKIDTGAGQLLYSTFLGGTCGEQGFGIALDPAGGALVVGVTNSPDFPVTPGALQTRYTGRAASGFLAKFTPQGSLSYATFLGGAGTDSARAVARDAQGGIYVTGSTFGFDSNQFGSDVGFLGFAFYDPAHQFFIGFPVSSSGAAYVLKLDPAASRRTYLKYVTASLGEGQAVAVDPLGRVWVAGIARPLFLGDPPLPTLHPFQAKMGDDFVTQLSPDGLTILFSSSVDGNALALDASGNAFVAGSTSVSDFYKYFYASALLTRIDVDVPASITVEEPQRLISKMGSLYPYPFDGIVPGEFLVLTGTGLGPDREVTAQFTPEGKVATMLAGTSVNFNGVPAPLISVQAGRIVCIAPFAIRQGSASLMRVQSNSDVANTIRLGVADTAVGVTAVLNPDGGVNSPGHPAAPDTILTIYAVGLGQTNPASVDGELGVAGQTKFLYGILHVYVEEAEVETVYAGPAPGQVAGITQINVRIPAQLPSGQYKLRVGWGISLFDDFSTVLLSVGPPTR